MRAYSGSPLSPSQSDLLTDTARTLTSTSSSLGIGLVTSLSPRTPGGPYCVYTTAFIIIPPQRPVPLARRWFGVGSTEVHLLHPFPHAQVGSGCTQRNNIAKSDAIPKWVIFEPFLADIGKPPQGEVRRRPLL